MFRSLTSTRNRRLNPTLIRLLHSTPVYKPVIVMPGIMSKKIALPSKLKPIEKKSFINGNGYVDGISLSEPKVESITWPMENIHLYCHTQGARKDFWCHDILHPNTNAIIDENVHLYPEISSKLLEQSIIDASITPALDNLLEPTDTYEQLSTESLLSLLTSPENGMQHMAPLASYSLLSLLVARNQDNLLTTKSYNTLISNMMPSDNSFQNGALSPIVKRHVLYAFARMKDTGKIPDSTTYILLFKAFKDVFVFMNAIYTTAIGLIVKSAKANEALPSTYNQKHNLITDNTFRVLLTCMDKLPVNGAKNIDVSVFWYDLVSKLQIKPSTATCIGFMKMAAKIKDERLLQEIHKHIKKSSNGWNAYVYESVMGTFIGFEKWLAVQHMMQDMSEANIPLTL